MSYVSVLSMYAVSSLYSSRSNSVSTLSSTYSQRASTVQLYGTSSMFSYGSLPTSYVSLFTVSSLYSESSRSNIVPTLSSTYSQMASTFQLYGTLSMLSYGSQSMSYVSMSSLYSESNRPNIVPTPSSTYNRMSPLNTTNDRTKSSHLTFLTDNVFSFNVAS